MLNSQDKENKNNISIVDSKEGERISLSCNKDIGRSPSLDLVDNNVIKEDQLVKYLAEILVEGFLWQEKHASNTKQQKSSHLL